MKRLFLFIMLSCVAFATQAYEVKKFYVPIAQKYDVLRIYDGDTFTILAENKYKVNVRISGIDAPERTQEFGMYARLYLERLIDNKPVFVQIVDIDKWGRTVAKCYNWQGKDIAEEMLRAGMAWHYAEYDSTNVYIDAEKEARYSSAGLWCRPNPMNPQKYRNAPRSIRQKN